MVCKKLSSDENVMTTLTSEKLLEKKFCDRVKAAGGLPLKFSSPSYAGVPDRIVLFPEGKIFFVELKSPNGNVSPIQKFVFDKFAELGFPVHVIHNEQMIESFFASIDI